MKYAATWVFWGLSVTAGAQPSPQLQDSAVSAPASDARGVVRVQMLARVGSSSISTRALYLYSCVKNPKSCGRYSDFVRRDSGRELQEYLLVKMAYEDNAIFRTVQFGDAELTKKTVNFEKTQATIWRRLQSELQVQEIELRSTLEEIAVFESLLARQASLETWIQQLRSRFKVQLFNQNAA